MYSRDKTLNTVENNDFKVFTNLMYSTSLNEKKFLDIANALTIIPQTSKNKTRQALFHIALITPKSCVENGKHPTRNKPFLCHIFPNPDAIQEILKKTNTVVKINDRNKTRIEYSTKELGIKDQHYNAYLIRKRKHINKWIIAKKRYFYKDSAWQNFYFFLTKRYIQTTSYTSKFNYTKYSIYVVLLSSFILWFLFKSKERKNLREYNSRIKESDQIKSTIIEKDKKYNILKNKIYMLEEEVRELEVKLTSNNTSSPQEKKQILETIRSKTIEQTQLDESLTKLKDEIIELEAKNDAIEELLNRGRTKLRHYERNVEYKKLTQETKTLKRLWRHEPTWTKRKQIENTVSLGENNLPFTLTQAFIAFERHIDDEIEKCFEGKELEENLAKTLIKKIDIIEHCKQLDKKQIDMYHKIRKARNKWVHGAIYPDKSLMEELLTALENTDVTPAL